VAPEHSKVALDRLMNLIAVDAPDPPKYAALGAIRYLLESELSLEVSVYTARVMTCHIFVFFIIEPLNRYVINLSDAYHASRAPI